MSNWYCVYTKPKQEDTVAKKLAELPNLEVFTPKVKRSKYARTTRKELQEQLFPSYIFTRFDPRRTAYIHLVKYTRGVKRFIGDCDGTPFIVEEAIIDSIRARMTNGFVHLELPKLVPGDKVCINEGPFSGFDGIFCAQLKAKDRVVILLNAIHYQAKLAIQGEFIAKSM